MIAFLALGLALLEFRASFDNLNTPYNGFGAVRNVWKRTAAAPMRYRALVPWLIGWIPTRRAALFAYWGIKALLATITLYACQAVLGFTAACGLALLIASTLEFDYWEQYPELIGIMLCLSGQPLWAALGCVIWGMSKETVWIAPALTIFGAGSLVGLVGPAVWILVHVYQGESPLYCERWTLRAYNWPDLRTAWKRLDVGPFWAVAWTMASLAALLCGRDMADPWRLTAWTIPLWLGAGWLLARVREVRVLLPTALWMLAATMGQ